MTNLLFIDEEIRNEIKQVVRYAEKNKVTKAKLKLTIAGDIPPVGDDPGHYLLIHWGYRVVFSIEEQTIGLCNHLSVSVEKKHKYPQPHVVKEILKLFEMDYRLEKSVSIWKEDKTQSINILQKRKEK